MSEKTSRIREKACQLRQIQAKIIKSKQNKKGTTNSTINHLLNCVPNFIGCYAEDELSSMMFNSFPCFLIVNIDPAHMTGSHWLALGIFRDRIEIFDPLGFELFSWPKISCDLLYFLHKYSFSRKVLVSKRIQASKSQNCGLYCIYYVMSRKIKSFQSLQSIFSSNCSVNDSILIKQFYFIKLLQILDIS